MPTSSDAWDPQLTYVIGHRRPDTDAIASALGYAWFLTQSGHDRIRPMRAGQPAEQTLFALNRFGQSPPAVLSGVAPTFGHIAENCPAVQPESPLADAMNRLRKGDPVVPVVGGDGKPLGVVTPLALARAYATSLDDYGDDGWPNCERLAVPAPTFAANDRLSDHRNSLLRSDANQFIVIDSDGRYIGLADQKDILSPPRARLILVDHNELSQAVVGAEEAEIAGVLDHHRLGNPPTAAPIPFVVDPVGSTSTLVAEQCRAAKFTPPTGIAGLLLSGILSDTLVFRSPTTCERDRMIAAWLAGICNVDVHAYGDELLRAAPGFGSRTAEEIVDGDRKSYIMGGVSVSIGQVEVTGMQELPQRRTELLDVLAERREREGLAFICLMVTDVVTGHSRLLCQGETRFVTSLPFSRVVEGEYDLGDMVSRKKQLAPAVQNVMESVI